MTELKDMTYYYDKYDLYTSVGLPNTPETKAMIDQYQNKDTEEQITHPLIKAYFENEVDKWKDIAKRLSQIIDSLQYKAANTSVNSLIADNTHVLITHPDDWQLLEQLPPNTTLTFKGTTWFLILQPDDTSVDGTTKIINGRTAHECLDAYYNPRQTCFKCLRTKPNCIPIQLKHTDGDSIDSVYMCPDCYNYACTK